MHQPAQHEQPLAGERYWWTPIAELDFNEHSAASISLTSSLLGAVIGFGLCALCVSGWNAFGVLCVYFALVSVYHMLEYLSVCLYNPERLEMGSFMFNPDVGNGYMTAMAVSLAEYLAGWLYCGGRVPGWLTCVGLLMALAGQTLRTLAMVTAGTSFNHYVATKRAADHELVTCGVYAVERHPSYVGFFLWAVGLQLMLSNLVSAGLFAAVLGYFFVRRTRREEQFLLRFFGRQYQEYRDRTSTLIPGVGR
ncbi:farnesyl cysteine-carboxyl methyltransferase [Coemansia sp. RSA 2611]|nr:farnesyl cysteine-carboxyl methyltransferase [Coemansia sp. RSA 2611]